MQTKLFESYHSVMYLFISELEKYLWTEKHSDLIVLKSKLLFTELLCPLIMVTSVSDLEKGKLGDGKGWKGNKNRKQNGNELD